MTYDEAIAYIHGMYWRGSKLGLTRTVELCHLLGDPQNILFDEPCAGLDIKYQEELNDLILQLKAQGRTILYAGHDPLEYVRFFDRIVFLGQREPLIYEAASLSGSSGDTYNTARTVAEIYRSVCEKVEGDNQ